MFSKTNISGTKLVPASLYKFLPERPLSVRYHPIISVNTIPNGREDEKMRFVKVNYFNNFM